MINMMQNIAKQNSLHIKIQTARDLAASYVGFFPNENKRFKRSYTSLSYRTNLRSLLKYVFCFKTIKTCFIPKNKFGIINDSLVAFSSYFYQYLLVWC